MIDKTFKPAADTSLDLYRQTLETNTFGPMRVGEFTLLFLLVFATDVLNRSPWFSKRTPAHDDQEQLVSALLLALR